MHSSRSALRLAMVLFTFAFLVACNEDGGFFPSLPDPSNPGGETSPPPTVEVSEFVHSAAISSVDGTYVEDTHPVGSTTAPMILGTSTFVQGASLVMEVTVDSTATQLYVGVANANLGYYSFDLNALPTIEDYVGPAVPMGHAAMEKAAQVNGTPPVAAATSAHTYVVEMQPVDSPTVRGFTVIMSTSDGTNVSATRRHIVAVNGTAAASDKLQVSLNWIHPVDLDLHVMTPSGEEIFFANRTGPAGGELDLDSNPACNIDNINNENITWAGVDPPAGEYIISLDLYAACEVTEDMPWIVTVLVNGQPTTYSGSFAPTDVNNPLLEITRVTIP